MNDEEKLVALVRALLWIWSNNMGLRRSIFEEKWTEAQVSFPGPGRVLVEVRLEPVVDEITIEIVKTIK